MASSGPRRGGRCAVGETRRRPAAPEVEHLLARLREVKERSGLSYAALGARTRCSKSSWQRYLCGRTLPPREAVEDLARLGGSLTRMRPFVVADDWTPGGSLDDARLRARLTPRAEQLSLF